MLADAAPASGLSTVTIISGALLALAAIVLARRRAAKEALASTTALGARSSDLTLAGWTALNTALQEKIRRLQGVQERMQARIDALETEIEQLRKLATSLKPDPGAPGA